jgi:MFS family permease
MTAGVVGCVLLQFPIGKLSDRFDRRRVIFVTTLVAGAAAFAITLEPSTGWKLYALVGVFGGLSLPLYSLCIAHANDFLEPEQMVGASGGLVLASGIGAVMGPLLVSVAMSQFGPDGLFHSLAIIHGLLGVFALYRMFRRQAKPLSEQGPHMPTAAHALQVAVELELNESTARQRQNDGP